MADDEDQNTDTSKTMLALMKSLNQSFNELKSQNNDVVSRLEALEKAHPPPPTPTPAVAHDISDQASIGDAFENSHDSDNEGAVEALAWEIDDTIAANHLGPEVADGVANFITKSMLGVDDKAKIEQIHVDNPRPSNVPALVVPELNKEIKISDINVTIKDGQLASVQRSVCTAMSILGDIVSDIGIGDPSSRKYERQQVFEKTNQVLSLLAASHKGISMARKLNVKPVLAPNLQFLCTSNHIKHEENRSSNTFLFDEDLGCEVDKAFRMNKISSKVSKNFKATFRGGRSSRDSGRGAPYQKRDWRSNRPSRGSGPKDRGLPRGRGRGRGRARD